MKQSKTAVILPRVIFLIFVFCLSFGSVFAAPDVRFISWADTQARDPSYDEFLDTQSRLSDQAYSLNPDFTIFIGDLENAGFTTTGMDDWKYAINGQRTGGSSSNEIYNKTFPVRGNHDSFNVTGWQNYFNLQQTGNTLGVSYYKEMGGKQDLVYSFDYGNCHFVALDALGGAGALTSEQVEWLDSDLSAAETRGLTHAFIYFHGPIYPVGYHCFCGTRVCELDDVVNELIAVINDHPIVSATFHGHDHVQAYTYLDNTRITGLTHPFHQFVTSPAGADLAACDKDYRYDYCMSDHGFVAVDVNGLDVTVNWYRDGSSTIQKTVFFTKQIKTTYECNDGIDNDGDSLIDYPADHGCSSVVDDSEYNSSGEGILTLVEHNYAVPSEGWDNAIDGDTQGWDGTVTADDNPPYAVFAFTDDSTQSISKVRLMTDTGVGFQSRWVTQFTVQVSTTNTNSPSFTTVLNKVNKNGGAWEEYTLSPVANAKYIKLILDQPSSGYRQIGEFEVNTGGTPSNPPTVPSNLTAQVASSSQINLSWQDNSNNETGFKIERSTSSSSGFSQIATVGANTTSYSSTSLAANTTYYYRVRAYNGAGDSSYSNTASATTNAAGTIPEDINQDGQVNVVDVQLCVNVFLGLESNPDIVARADVNNDGSVNVIDVQKIVNVFLEG